MAKAVFPYLIFIFLFVVGVKAQTANNVMFFFFFDEPPKELVQVESKETSSIDSTLTNPFIITEDRYNSIDHLLKIIWGNNYDYKPVD